MNLETSLIVVFNGGCLILCALFVFTWVGYGLLSWTLSPDKFRDLEIRRIHTMYPRMVSSEKDRRIMQVGTDEWLRTTRFRAAVGSIALILFAIIFFLQISSAG